MNEHPSLEECHYCEKPIYGGLVSIELSDENLPFHRSCCDLAFKMIDDEVLGEDIRGAEG